MLISSSSFSHRPLLIVVASVLLATEAQLANPGEDGYWLKLQDIWAPKGQLTPDFDPDVTQYELRVPGARLKNQSSFRIQLMLDLPKYNMRREPKLVVDGKELEYSALEDIITHIDMPETYGPVEQEVKIKVVDPVYGQDAGFFSKLLGFGAERSTEYVLKVRKEPDLDACVRSSSLSVTDGSGQEFQAIKPFDIHSKAEEYQFILPRHLEQVNIRMVCPDFPGDSVQMYDNHKVPIGDTMSLDMTKTMLRRVTVMCTYYKHGWMDHSVQRQYILDLDKHMEAEEAKSTQANIAVLGHWGSCEALKSDDPVFQGRSGHKDKFLTIQADQGFLCKVSQPLAPFIATYSSALGDNLVGELKNEKTGLLYALNNAMPSTIPVTHDKGYFTLMLRAGDATITYPVNTMLLASCSTAPCPENQVVKTLHPGNPLSDMCAEETCTEQDVEQCCVARATCDTFPAACPHQYELRPDAASAFCASAACDAQEDQETCCAPTTSTTTTTITSTSTTGTQTTSTTSSSTSSTGTHTSTTVTFTTITNSTTHTTSTSSTLTETTSTTTTATTTSVTVTSTTFTGTTTTTSSSSSSTSTSSTLTGTTTTTTLYCAEVDVVYLPLDMEGVLPSIEMDRQACRRRCANTPRCLHYSFWAAGGHCHLTDEKAQRMAYGFGFESGPRVCKEEFTVTRTTTQMYTENFECIQVGVDWTPAFESHFATNLAHADREGHLRECREYCQSNQRCTNFVFDRASNACRLAGIEASPMPSLDTLISGPPQCGEIYQEIGDLVMRKYEGATSAHLQKPVASASLRRVALLSTVGLAVFVSLLLSLAWRWRPAGNARDMEMTILLGEGADVE